jgi:hypothetical protein
MPEEIIQRKGEGTMATEVTKRSKRDASPTAESLANVENAYLADSDI